MEKYNLSASITVSVYTVIEANSLEEALKIAEGRDIERGEWNNKNQKNVVWVNDELDGEVKDIEFIYPLWPIS